MKREIRGQIVYVAKKFLRINKSMKYICILFKEVKFYKTHILVNEHNMKCKKFMPIVTINKRLLTYAIQVKRSVTHASYFVIILYYIQL